MISTSVSEPMADQMDFANDKRGFSLLEVLLSMCLLGIAMMALATLQSRGIRGNDLGNRTSQAVSLAQDQLEERIHASRSATLAAGAFNDANNPIDETGAGGGIFTRSWTVQNNTPVTNNQTIAVAVTWNDIIGQHTVRVSGIITNDSH